VRTVTIAVDEVKQETDLAFLFVLPCDGPESDDIFDDARERIWVPKSVIEDADDLSRGDVEIEVEIAEWFAIQEGLS